jgi:arylsulfatase A-like enzyme
MTLRRLLPALLLALLLPACARPRSAPPNVVLIVVDTLRVDRLSCYGNPRPTTPHLDALAAQGVRYSRAHSQAPWTTPSIAALLTSQYPSVLGIREEPDALADHWELLPEVLKENGYATGAVISHYFLDSKWNFDQGFDSFDESNIRGHAEMTSPGVTASALAFVRQHQREPFFLFVHYFDPHYNYLDHPEFPFTATTPPYDGPVHSGMVYTDLEALAPELGPRDRDYLLALYDSEIAFTDRAIGDLLAGLEKLGLTEDTLIVFTADHGEEFLERNTIGHGGTLYEEQIHVPLLVRYPDYRPTSESPRQPWPNTDWRGSTLETPVALIDLFPTILDYLGVASDVPLAGRSLLGATPNTEPPARVVFSETDWGHYRAALNQGYKLIVRPTTGQRFFFDLSADPQEKHNLAARLAQTNNVANYLALKPALERWLEYLDSAAGKSETLELTEQERQQLRALGYLN